MSTTSMKDNINAGKISNLEDNDNVIKLVNINNKSTESVNIRQEVYEWKEVTRKPRSSKLNENAIPKTQANINIRRVMVLCTGKISEEQKESGFSGMERKVWLNIYRVNSHVTSDMIAHYIKDKDGFLEEKVTVGEIPTKTPLKQFVVMAPLKRKDELYETSFWPPGVGIRRFMIHVYKKKHGSLNFL